MGANGFRERKLYRYDALNRLVGVWQGEGDELKYYYDSVGNLLAVNTANTFSRSTAVTSHTKSGMGQTSSLAKESPALHRDLPKIQQSVNEERKQSDALLHQANQSHDEAKMSPPVFQDVQGMDKPRWFILRDKSQYGPYAWRDLIAFKAQNRLLRNDLVWSKDLKEWTRAEKIEGLF
jgi:YD repeat-containing protein